MFPFYGRDIFITDLYDIALVRSPIKVIQEEQKRAISLKGNNMRGTNPERCFVIFNGRIESVNSVLNLTGRISLFFLSFSLVLDERFVIASSITPPRYNALPTVSSINCRASILKWDLVTLDQPRLPAPRAKCFSKRWNIANNYEANRKLENYSSKNYKLIYFFTREFN